MIEGLDNIIAPIEDANTVPTHKFQAKQVLEALPYEFEAQTEAIKNSALLGIFDIPGETPKEHADRLARRARGESTTPLERYRDARDKLHTYLKFNSTDIPDLETKYHACADALDDLVAQAKLRVTPTPDYAVRYGEAKRTDEEIYLGMLSGLSRRFRELGTKYPKSVHISGGTYYMVDGKIINKPQPKDRLSRLKWYDPELPGEASLIHVDHRTVMPAGTTNPGKVLIGGGFHADELRAIEVYDEDISPHLPFARIEVLNPNIAASLLSRRGNLEPVTTAQIENAAASEAGELVIAQNAQGFDERGRKGEAKDLQRELEAVAVLHRKGEIEAADIAFSQLKPKLLELFDETPDHRGKGATVARKIDMNREFTLQGDEKTKAEVIAHINHPEAKMTMQALLDHPENEVVFVIHEDVEQNVDTGNGIYFIVVGDPAVIEKHGPVIKKLWINCEQKLTAKGFKILRSQATTPGDPYLGDSKTDEHGLILQSLPMFDAQGKKIPVKAFEDAAVRAGQIGLTNTIFGIDAEFPAGKGKSLTKRKRRQATKIILDEFMTPLLKYLGITIANQ